MASNEDDRTVSVGSSSGQSLAENSGPGTADMALMGHALAHGDTELAHRYQVARYAGLAFGGDRDYYETLGYDRDPDPEEYLAKYLRSDIARTIVNAPASTAWRQKPHIIDDAEQGNEDEAETEFEQAVEYLFEDFRLLHYLERWDKTVGLGEYGVLFVGTRENVDDEDGEPPDLDQPLEPDSLEPVDPSTTGEDAAGGLAYLSTFTQGRVEDIELVQDPRDPRFGHPEYYDLEFVTENIERTERVHYTRVLHAAEGLLENEVFGRPRLQAVLNRLEDLEKVVGGSAEMFWRGARRDLHLNYTGDGSPQDADDLEEQATEWVHDMRNVLRTSNVDAQDLGGQTPDPTGNVEQLLKLIAGGTEPRIPVRILVGSERGELASTQDRAEWLTRVGERQEQFCEPMLLRPLLDRFVQVGILPEPTGDGYSVEWPDLFELTELERAELRKEQSTALKNAGSQASRSIASPAEIREKVFDWDGERGSEVTGEDPEQREVENEGDPTEPTPEEQSEFEEMFEDLRGTAQSGVTLGDGGSVLQDEQAVTEHRIAAGETVLTPNGPGVVVGRYESDVSFPTNGQTRTRVQANEDDPAYHVVFGGRSALYRLPQVEPRSAESASTLKNLEQRSGPTGSALAVVGEVGFEAEAWPEGMSRYSALAFLAETLRDEGFSGAVQGRMVDTLGFEAGQAEQAVAGLKGTNRAVRAAGGE